MQQISSPSRKSFDNVNESNHKSIDGQVDNQYYIDINEEQEHQNENNLFSNYNDADEGDEVDEASVGDESSIGKDEYEESHNKQSWKTILLLSFLSLGSIYGDLGTSPLYVLNSINYSQYPQTKMIFMVQFQSFLCVYFHCYFQIRINCIVCWCQL